MNVVKDVPCTVPADPRKDLLGNPCLLTNWLKSRQTTTLLKKVVSG